MTPPAVTGSGASVIVTAMSAAATTVVEAVELLSVVSGSGSVSVTVAVFDGVPTAVVVVVIVTVAVAPLARAPIAQDTLGEAKLHVPCVEIAETKATLPVGSGSVATTFVASRKPLLVTSSV